MVGEHNKSIQKLLLFNFRSATEDANVKFNIPKKSMSNSFNTNTQDRTIYKQTVLSKHLSFVPTTSDKPIVSSKPDIRQKPLISRKPASLQKIETKSTTPPPPTPPPKPLRKSLLLTKIIRPATDLVQDVNEPEACEVIDLKTGTTEDDKNEGSEAVTLKYTQDDFHDDTSNRTSSDSFDSWDEEDDEDDIEVASRYSVTGSTFDLFNDPISENVILHVEKLFKHNPECLPSKDNIIKSCRIIQELIDNEKEYINRLKQGIVNYIVKFDSDHLPSALKGQKRNLFSNIEAIHEFHDTKFFPKLLECDFDPEKIANAFTNLIDGYQFDIYVIYVLNRKKSEDLLKANSYYFKQLQKDRLGIGSFLILPIQRLPRYQLLLAEIIKNLMKDLDNQKAAIAACCIAEKHIQRLLNTVNEHC